MAKRLGILLFCVYVGGCAASPTRPSPFSQNLTGTVAAFDTSRQTLAAPRAGALTVQLAWPDAAVDLDLYLAPVTCTVLYPQSGCGILAASTTAGSTTETVTRNVSSGENFTIFVDNLSVSRSTDYTISITIQ